LSNKSEDKPGFLCGNAGILAVLCVIHREYNNNPSDFKNGVEHYLSGFSTSLQMNYNKYGSDEILFGRAGYLSGIYWINQHLSPNERISSDVLMRICDCVIESGIQYSRRNNLQIPMMWECYGDKYLGAAHGICAILHMLLESPLFSSTNLNLQNLNDKQRIIKSCIDIFLNMQSPIDGNFPCVLEEANKNDHKLVHWCHGASGTVYLFAKAYLVFNDQKYLHSILRSGDLMWNKGLLKKGPGICHGIAGNGYVFLILYRLTNDPRHLHRASCFADFLTNETFLREARQPDHPHSLYEGSAGTICFLIDLLNPLQATFPFMDCFDVKF
jgi:hypothetical protein